MKNTFGSQTEAKKQVDVFDELWNKWYSAQKVPQGSWKRNNSLTCRELLVLELIGIEPTTY